MRYAVGKGCFIAVAGGNEFEDTVPPYGTNPTSVLAEIASRIPGAVSVAAVDRAQGARLLLEHRQLHRARGAGRIRARLRQQRLRAAADLRLHLHRHVPAAAGAVRRAAVRRVRLHRLHRHVDGGAARRRRRRDADAAGRHRSRRRSKTRWRRPRSTSARPAATTRSASDWWMRARRCADWGWRSEDASSCLLVGLALAAPAAAQDRAARCRIRPFVDGDGEAVVRRDRHVRRDVRQDLRAVLRRRRAGRGARPLLRRSRRLAVSGRPASAPSSAAARPSSSASR